MIRFVSRSNFDEIECDIAMALIAQRVRKVAEAYRNRFSFDRREPKREGEKKLDLCGSEHGILNTTILSIL